MESRFDKFKDISQGLQRTLNDTFTSASMSLVQIKVINDYYSSKRVTPFFIGEEELLEYNFQAFKERLVKEVPHLAKITSLSAAPLRITINDEKNEVDLSPVHFWTLGVMRPQNDGGAKRKQIRTNLSHWNCTGSRHEITNNR